MIVIPAKAGIHFAHTKKKMNVGLRRDDGACGLFVEPHRKARVLPT
ncbi:MAG: hypothetical protein ACREPH_12660 [Rhodanobacteraceae bacterium]